MKPFIFRIAHRCIIEIFRDDDANGWVYVLTAPEGKHRSQKRWVSSDEALAAAMKAAAAKEVKP